MEEGLTFLLPVSWILLPITLSTFGFPGSLREEHLVLPRLWLQLEVTQLQEGVSSKVLGGSGGGEEA